MFREFQTIKGSLNFHLVLDGCGISGGIPSEIEVLTKLNYLDLSNNAFSGNVPVELSKLNNLGKFAFSHDEI